MAVYGVGTEVAAQLAMGQGAAQSVYDQPDADSQSRDWIAVIVLRTTIK